MSPATNQLLASAMALPQSERLKLAEALLVASEPIESLPDAEVLALCDAEMEASQQDELGLLQDKNREGQLQPHERERFDELMLVYRRGLIRKSRALRVAVARGIRSPLT